MKTRFDYADGKIWDDANGDNCEIGTLVMIANNNEVELAALRARVERLEGALKPFAKCAEAFDGCETDNTVFDSELQFSPKDLHIARAVLENK